jgi:hypothetical protein
MEACTSSRLASALTPSKIATQNGLSRLLRTTPVRTGAGLARRRPDGGLYVEPPRVGSDSFEDRDPEWVVENIDDAHSDSRGFGPTVPTTTSTATTAAVAICHNLTTTP